MTDVFNFQPCRLPLLVSVPHAGTRVPGDIEKRFSEAASVLPDTDWFVDRLYEWVTELGAGLITANFSRYVIDLNRPPDDEALYQSSTPGLIPIHTFSGDLVYDSEPPDAQEAGERLINYWHPYHRAIRSELNRMRDIHGYAVLFDAHSIRSRVPQLFEGNLPDLNLGSFNGQSACRSLVAAAMAAIMECDRYSNVLDGRFKGGYITRHYGQPGENIHALQLEMSQAVYMNEDPPEFDIGLAKAARELLTPLLNRIIDWRPVSE